MGKNGERSWDQKMMVYKRVYELSYNLTSSNEILLSLGSFSSKPHTQAISYSTNKGF